MPPDPTDSSQAEGMPSGCAGSRKTGSCHSRGRQPLGRGASRLACPIRECHGTAPARRVRPARLVGARAWGVLRTGTPRPEASRTGHRLGLRARTGRGPRGRCCPRAVSCSIPIVSTAVARKKRVLRVRHGRQPGGGGHVLRHALRRRQRRIQLHVPDGHLAHGRRVGLARSGQRQLGARGQEQLHPG